MNTQMRDQALPGGEEVKEKVREVLVREVLKVIGVESVEKLSRVEAITALGRLLSVKMKFKPGAKPSVHEVTKEVRKALEMVVRSPLREDPESAIKTAIYTNPPFKRAVLNEVYILLLEKLLREIVNLVEQLGPMWRKRVVNWTIENIYNIAVIDRDYGKKIKKTLKTIGSKKFRGEGE